MKAYLGDTKLKEELLTEIKLHEEADEIRQGTYGKDEDGKFVACAVGCAITSYNAKRGTDYKTNDHKVYENQLGIPESLAYLEDRIFEGLETEESKTFPHKFMSSIAPGADLSLVVPKFMVWLLADGQNGVIRFADDNGKKAIFQVTELYERVIAGGLVSDDEWDKAAAAARAAAAAAGAAEAAARAAAAAARAAGAAAEAAEAAARAAAAAAGAAEAAARAAAAAAGAAEAAARAEAAAAADWDAARAAARAEAAARAAYKQMAYKLIEILEETK